MAIDSYTTVPENHSWRPGFLKRVPGSCLAALVLAICCAAGAVVTLVSSDDVDIDTWPTRRYPIQPAVLLSILSATANTALRFALSEGCTLSWWTRAIKGGTINDLHRYWAYGTSLKDSALSGKHFNKVALASLITSMVVIDGPLLQRATRVETKPATQNTTVSASLSSDPLPNAFSGIYLSRSHTISMFQPRFAQVVQEHRAQSDIKLNYTGCRGSCDVTLIAAGLDVNCSYGTLPFEIPTTTVSGGDMVSVGSLNTNWEPTSSPGQITTNITYKDTTACSGTLKTARCTLSAATVAYPVRITNGSAQLLPASTNNNNNTIRLQDASELYEASSPTPGMGSTYGGLALAMAQQFPASQIDLYYTMQWDVHGAGTMQTTYLSAASQDAVGECSMAWTDPTPDILLFARDLMFRSAVKASNSSAAQTHRTFEEFDRTVYTSNYAYLVGALAVVVADVFVLLPLLWGWWVLGRRVSLSPVEVAKAFRAPMVAEAESNASVGALLGRVGRKRVEYGFVPVAVGEDDDGAWMLGNGGRAGGKEDESESVEMVGMSGGSAGVLCFSRAFDDSKILK